MQVNNVSKGSFSVLSELCEAENHPSLKLKVIDEAVEQQILKSSESPTRVIIAPTGLLVNFVVKDKV